MAVVTPPVRLVVDRMHAGRPPRRVSPRLVVAGAVVGVLVGLLLVAATPVRTTATATVELADVSPAIRLDASGRGRRVSVDTDAQLLRGDAVREAVETATGEAAPEVDDALSVTARPLTRLLDISYTAPTSDVALSGASAAATAFLQERDRVVTAPLRRSLGDLVDGSSDVVSLLGAGGTTPQPGGGNLSEAVSSLELSRVRAIALLPQVAFAGEVVEAARITSPPSRGQSYVTVLSGAALGALLALLFGGRRATGAVRGAP